MSLKGRLNCSMSIICLNDGSKLNHAAGPATENARFQNFVLMRGTSTAPVADDRSAGRPGRTEIVVATLEMYSGLRPFASARIE